MYHFFKKIAIKCLGYLRKRILDFNHVMNSRNRVKALLSTIEVSKLTVNEIKEAKSFFKSRGYKLKNTDWHTFYKSMNGEFHKDYIPLGLFKTKISPKLNESTQWPALLDKNIIYRIFRDFELPKRVVQNINGFYYINDKPVNINEAINEIGKNGKQLIIKPSIDSGGGKKVVAFKVTGHTTSYNNLSIEELLKVYKKDFIVQEFLEQSDTMGKLNPSSLNTLRVISYLNDDGVNIISTTARVGGLNSHTDNYSSGGLLCGVDDDGKIKTKGYSKKGEALDHTFSGAELMGYVVPNYNLVVDMVKSVHVRLPYFKLVSWDIAINKDNKPVLVEYNTYNQGLEVQIVTGPLFGKFTDEILAKALE